MKKKLLIVSHALELGGAERSLIGLLNAFDFEKYDVDLFLLRHEGELMREIPSAVNLLPEIRAYTVLARPIKRTLKEGHFILSMARLAGKMAAAKYNRILLKKNFCISNISSISKISKSSRFSSLRQISLLPTPRRG